MVLRVETVESEVFAAGAVEEMTTRGVLHVQSLSRCITKKDLGNDRMI